MCEAGNGGVARKGFLILAVRVVCALLTVTAGASQAERAGGPVKPGLANRRGRVATRPSHARDQIVFKLRSSDA